MRKLCLALCLTFAAATTLTGCVIVSKKPRHGHSAHPSNHRHDHCHQRGRHGKNRVCHSHPHGPGHH